MISPDIASQWSSLNTTAPAAISQRTVRDITLPTVRLPTAIGVARAELRRCIVRDADVEPLLARHDEIEDVEAVSLPKPYAGNGHAKLCA